MTTRLRRGVRWLIVIVGALVVCNGAITHRPAPILFGALAAVIAGSGLRRNR